MLRANADDIVLPRPTLTASQAMAAALRELEPGAASRADLWRMMVDSFTVDLDALGAILPLDEPEPVWLAARA